MSTKDNVSKLTDEELIEIFNNSLNKSDFRRKAHISRRNRRVPRRCKELGLDFDTIKGKMPPLK